MKSSNSRFAILAEENNEKKHKKIDKKHDKKEDKKIDKKEDKKIDKKEDKEHDKEHDKKEIINIDVNTTQKFNSFKNDKPKYGQSLYRSEREIKEDELKRKNAQLEKNLIFDNNNFPELSNQTTTNFLKTDDTMSCFLEKVNQEKVEEVKDVENPLYGWTIIKRNKNTHLSELFYNKQQNENNPLKSENNENADELLLLDTLTNMYFNRTYNYIDNWGYDEYEKMFLFPNYDPDYFDKLDAKDELELETQNNVNEESEEYSEDYHDEIIEK